MSQEPKLIYSQEIEGTEYTVKYYDNYSISFTSNNEDINFTKSDLTYIINNIDYDFEFIKDLCNLVNNNIINDEQYNFLKNFFKFADDNQTYLEKNTTDKELLEKELTDFYLTLKQAIKDKYQQAQENDKELIVLSGECHNSIYSLIVKLITVFNANAVGIKNIMLESSTNPLIFDVVDAILFQNKNWNIHLVDPLIELFSMNNYWFTWKKYSNKEVCGYDTRAKAINESIGKIGQSVVSSYGALHLNDIYSDPQLQSQNEFVIINTMPLLPKEMLNKVRFMEKVFNLQLDHELHQAKGNKDIDFDKYQKYILEKKQNIHCSQNFDYLANPEILQVPAALHNSNLKVMDTLEIILKVLKQHIDPNDHQAIEFLQFLENNIYALSAKIEYIYDNPEFEPLYKLFEEEYIESGRSLGIIGNDEGYFNEASNELIELKQDYDANQSNVLITSAAIA